MSEKSALFMARTTRFHEFARSLTTTLGVEVSLATPRFADSGARL